MFSFQLNLRNKLNPVETSAPAWAWLDADVTAKLAAIVESSDDAIIGKDLNGIITTWNQAAERLFGYPEREAIGQPVTILMPADRVDEAVILERLRRRERIDHFDTVRRRKDGTLLHISMSVSPIIDAYGKIAGSAAIARDIPRWKKAESAYEKVKNDIASCSNCGACQQV